MVPQPLQPLQPLIGQGIIEGVDHGQLSVAQQMAELAQALTLAHTLERTAQVVAEVAASLIPGAQEVSMSLARRGVGIETIASRGSLPGRADAAQVDTGQGPCIEAAWKEQIARLEDTETDRRWPTFSARAKALGVGSMLSLQLSLPREREDDRIGAINCYSRAPRSFGRDSETIGMFIAIHASVGVAAAEREEQLRLAIGTRDVIGQAKGMIMSSQGISAEAAFAVMVQQARDTNVRIHDLATRLVSRHPGS